MEGIRLLQEFFDATREDIRVSPVHVSLYAVLFSLWGIKGAKNPLSIDRGEIMQLAKISTRVTYYRCMNELQEFGFIKYIPSVNQFLESLVYLLDPDEKISSKVNR